MSSSEKGEVWSKRSNARGLNERACVCRSACEAYLVVGRAVAVCLACAVCRVQRAEMRVSVSVNQNRAVAVQIALWLAIAG
jgi:hypothetical protein